MHSQRFCDIPDNGDSWILLSTLNATKVSHVYPSFGGKNFLRQLTHLP